MGGHKRTSLGATFGTAPSSEPRAATAGPPPDDVLAAVREGIVHRLSLAQWPRSPAADLRLPPTPEEVASFADVVVREGLLGAMEFVLERVREGVSIESVLLLIAAPAARLLGDQWQEGDRTLNEVASGLAVVRQVVMSLRTAAEPDSQG